MSDRLAYDLGVYVQQLRAQEETIQRVLVENNPWPDNVHPSGIWHEGQMAALHDVINHLEWMIPKAQP